MSKQILLIEDEAGLSLTLTDLLETEGYRVLHAGDGDQGYRTALEKRPDLIVLDLMLPGKSGLDLCRDLRANGTTTPILMLTAKSDLLDKVIGLKMGADDYLTKPFENLELLARIEALLRRGRPVPNARHHRFGDTTVDLERAEIKRKGAPIHLSAREFQLLRHFLEHRGKLLSRDQLMDEVWGYDVTVNTRTIDATVANLRQKLEPVPHQPTHILTVHGMGYRFCEDG